jgi:DNA-binding HxlR family transcriptional regulator
MSEDLKEEMKKLKEEMAGLKDQLRDVLDGGRRRNQGMYIDIGAPVHEYVEDVMKGVAEGVHGELEKSIFIGPRGVRIFRRNEPFRDESEDEVSFPKMAGAMSALGHEHRLKILNELMSGGKYINELQEKLSEITTSTLSSHLNILEEAGLVVQEKVRGRYLITLPGRTAYKMARQIVRFLERRDGE